MFVAHDWGTVETLTGGRVRDGRLGAMVEHCGALDRWVGEELGGWVGASWSIAERH